MPSYFGSLNQTRFVLLLLLVLTNFGDKPFIVGSTNGSGYGISEREQMLGMARLVTDNPLIIMILKLFRGCLRRFLFFAPAPLRKIVNSLTTGNSLILTQEALYISRGPEIARTKAGMTRQDLMEILATMWQGEIGSEKDRQKGMFNYIARFWERSRENRGDEACIPAYVRIPESKTFNTYKYRLVFWSRRDRRPNLFNGHWQWVHTEFDFRKLPTDFCYLLCDFPHQCMRKKYFLEQRRPDMKVP